MVNDAVCWISNTLVYLEELSCMALYFPVLLHRDLHVIVLLQSHTYIHKLTTISHGRRQKLQNATCYDP